MTAARSRTAVSAADFIPETSSLAELRAAAARCRGCDLYRFATQTVFGEGPAHATFMFVGEQPGDVEDRRGSPFVGPAGQLLRRALRDADIDERDAYITNAVKHFKFVERGKRRVHQSPKRIEIVACTPWLEAELQAVRPNLVVALGATAAQALFGPAFRLTQHRGEVLSAPLAPRAIVTMHPSAILRSLDDAARSEQLAAFVDDLRFAKATAAAKG